MFYIDENTTESLFTIKVLNNTGISAEVNITPEH